ncbi:MAG TPA: glycosyltransferase [Myxococcota bacterium]|nr:glycosyltransferase [Myxococcota bacterium]
MKLPLVVYSHLRWNSVYQRPHHLAARFARERTVVFVEEPLFPETEAPDSWDLDWASEDLVVARPRVAVEGAGFPWTNLRFERMTSALLRALGIRHHIAWLYTPLATRLALSVGPTSVAYDCMDDLSSFLGAPPEMALREAHLLRAADVVFTGGASLYRAKRALHPNVHCVPSSVDATHFRTARDPRAASDPVPAAPHPRLGFYGVLDERFDCELVDGVAAARPDWQIMLVGPVAKIDPASLPRRPNLHYLGQRPYEELPAHLAHWDVCLLPFARNEATKFISPTKTLEYMAAEKPIVSTTIRDVVEPYGHVVEIADDAAGFVAACEKLLAEDAQARARRAAAMRRLVARTSWDATARAMSSELERGRRAVRPTSARSALPASALREDGAR